jgi:hypothetical protein
MNSYKLSDEIIAQIAKLTQLAIITGTDVVDNLRTLRVEVSDSESDTLVLTEEYRLDGEAQVSKLMDEVSNLNKEIN